MFYVLKTLYIAPGPTQQAWGEFLSVGSAPHPSLQCYHPGGCPHWGQPAFPCLAGWFWLTGLSSDPWAFWSHQPLAFLASASWLSHGLELDSSGEEHREGEQGHVWGGQAHQMPPSSACLIYHLPSQPWLQFWDLLTPVLCGRPGAQATVPLSPWPALGPCGGTMEEPPLHVPSELCLQRTWS